MAVTPKELKEKIKNTKLSVEQLKEVDVIEKWIDNEILKQEDSIIIRIDLTIPSFRYNPITKKSDYGSTSSLLKELKQDELERRYKAAGWKISVELDDGLDGPNMSGPDYWILTPKK